MQFFFLSVKKSGREDAPARTALGTKSRAARAARSLNEGKRERKEDARRQPTRGLARATPRGDRAVSQIVTSISGWNLTDAATTTSG